MRIAKGKHIFGLQHFATPTRDKQQQ